MDWSSCQSSGVMGKVGGFASLPQPKASGNQVVL